MKTYSRGHKDNLVPGPMPNPAGRRARPTQARYDAAFLATLEKCPQIGRFEPSARLFPLPSGSGIIPARA